MSLIRWRKIIPVGKRLRQNPKRVVTAKNERQQQESDRVADRDKKRSRIGNIQIVYLASDSPLETLIANFRSISDQEAAIFTSEEECICYVSNISDDKLFLILDSQPSETLRTSLESLPHVYSIFVYSTSIEDEAKNNPIQNDGNINQSQNKHAFIDTIRKTHDEMEKLTPVFNLYNQEEKATRDLSKEAGSFLFFQLLKNVIMNMPKTTESKQTMLVKCRDFYHDDPKQLADIDDFDETYKSTEAIQWYTKESFVYKFINKALRTEDVDVLYHFRFYIIDLCEQLKIKFNEFKSIQTDVLKLYRGLKVTRSELALFEQNVGSLISTNGYLSTSRLRQVAYDFAKKPSKRQGIVAVLFEYQVDLNSVKNIVLADVAQYSVYPDEAEVLFDIGASFRIESSTFDENDNLWKVIAQATDEGALLAGEFLDYQKKKMAESNIVLMFGHLLIEMGECDKAEKYFDNVLASNPNDEECACVYFNFGRAYRLKGDFNEAIRYYSHAYDLHNRAKPRRFVSAAKALNGLGISESELGNQEKAIEYFNKALKYLHKTVPRKHIDVAGILINLASIYRERKEYDLALKNSLSARKIYKRSLPPTHPNNASAMITLGNIYFCQRDYNKALQEYEGALKIQESALPNNHPDLARTILNIGLVYAYQGIMTKATEHFNQAAEIASQTLSPEHPLMCLINKSQNHNFQLDDSCIMLSL